MFAKKRYLIYFLTLLLGIGIYGYETSAVFAAQSPDGILEAGYTYQFQEPRRASGNQIVFQSPTNKAVSSADDARFVSQIQSNVVAFCVYEALETHIEELKTGVTAIPFSITLPSSYRSSDFGYDLQTGIDAFDRDFSEVFWIDVTKMMFYYRTSINGGKIFGEIRLAPGYSNYFHSDYRSKSEVVQDITRVNAKIAELTAQASGSKYDQVKFFHDYLIEKNEYNLQLFSNRASSKAWEITSGLYYGNTDKNNVDNPVCEGYARSLKVLCDAVGIPNVLVSGAADGEDHMWNYVKLDGKWYAVDTTWDDPIYRFYAPSYEQILKNRYAYFLKGSSDFLKHKSDGQIYPGGYAFSYPNLSAESYRPTTAVAQSQGPNDKNDTVKNHSIFDPVSVVRTPTVSMETILGYGKSKMIRIDNLQEDAEITYQSSNKKIVYVYSNGKIKGMKKGKAIITMNIVQGGKKFTLQTVVTCK